MIAKAGAINLHQAHTHWSRVKFQRQVHRILLMVSIGSVIAALSILVYTMGEARASNVNFSLTINGIDICGDGAVDNDETCDDGSLLNGQPNQCNETCDGDTPAVCGNTVVESGEQCDDGNTTSGDGCSDLCQTESGGNPGGGGSTSGGGSGSIPPPPSLPVVPLPTVTDVGPLIPTPPIPIEVDLLADVSSNPLATINNLEPLHTVLVSPYSKPIFRGRVGVPFAVIRLILRSDIVTTVIKADATGKWQWQSPTQLADGPHELMITIYSADGTKVLVEEFILRFMVDASNRGQYDEKINEIIKKLENSPESDKAIILEEALSFEPSITYKSLGSRIALDMGLSVFKRYETGEPIKTRLVINRYRELDSLEQQFIYTLHTIDGEKVWEQKALHTVQPQTDIVTDLALPFHLKPGRYQLAVTFPYSGVTAVSSTVFEVTELAFPLAGVVEVNWLIVLQTIVAFLIIALLVSYAEYRYLQNLGRISHPISEADLRRMGYIA